MSVVRRIARPLLAAAVINEGVTALRSKEAAAELAEGFGARLARPLGIEETHTDVVVRANAGVQIAGGLLLATGRFPRLAAAALALSLAGTTIARDSFWAAQSQDVPAKQARFVADLGLLGGVLLAAVDTAGRPSVGWRARRAARKAADKASEIAPW
ncbi:DoxX family membrane protein [Fodinicola acaciae]|uniref:DoxX family membrane protein n=1 Tax=Fodinicola acaciae TaxID=2681555 RepID=UPI0013D882F8|nr:DoxX family membrane protein [Fodinicola acaciae]